MTLALAVLEDSLRRDRASPRSLVLDGGTPVAFRHYPEGDLFDPVTWSQAYFHTHDIGLSGHFHLFLRPAGMPAGLRAVAGPADAPAHLGAIELGDDGWPVAVFATNRWVTGEAWYQSADLVRMLPCFALELSAPHHRLGQWLNAFVAGHRATLARLAVLREEELTDDGLEDESQEILVRLPLA